MTDSPRLLPIGVQTFSQIIEQGYLYVDKTAHALIFGSAARNLIQADWRRVT